MFLPFGFSIQEFLICYFYCPKTAFVCEFQHIPLLKTIFLATLHNFGEYDILHTCTQLKQKQEYEVRKSIFTSENGFFGLQNTAVLLRRSGKKLFV
jgi:hypothetical protein